MVIEDKADSTPYPHGEGTGASRLARAPLGLVARTRVAASVGGLAASYATHAPRASRYSMGSPGSIQRAR